jgi:hypothetical protein
MNILYIYIYIYIYILTAIRLSTCGSSTVHIYTQTIHRTTQITTNVADCWPWPIFASCTLAYALQLTKKHGKVSVRLRKTSVRVQFTYYQRTQPNTHTHTHTHIHTHTHTHSTKQVKTTTVQVKTTTVQVKTITIQLQYTIYPNGIVIT